MRILGYSERGIVSSLFNEIAFSQDSTKLLSRILSLITFPFIEFIPMEIKEANALIEQSFSDFGNLDALLLLNMNNTSLSILFEAKVKPIQSRSWSFNDEWKKFIIGTRNRVGSSNLFTQLYHKVRLVEGLRETGIEGLKSGLKFPSCSTKSIRKIGSNEIVLRAVNMLQRYLQCVYYVSLIPEDSSQAEAFFIDILRDSSPKGFIGWDVSQYGYLTWVEVERFCVINNLQNTLAVFEHNKGQIY